MVTCGHIDALVSELEDRNAELCRRNGILATERDEARQRRDSLANELTRNHHRALEAEADRDTFKREALSSQKGEAREVERREELEARIADLESVIDSFLADMNVREAAPAELIKRADREVTS